MSLIPKLEERFSKNIQKASDDKYFPYVQIELESVPEILKYCRENPEMDCDFLFDLFGVDDGEEYQIIYRLRCSKTQSEANVRCVLNRHEPEFSSVVGLWPAASLYEREICEMFGFALRQKSGSALAPLFLPEGWAGYPLRKSYVFPQEVEGIEHHRPLLRKAQVRP